MKTDIKSEPLTRLKHLVAAHVADPNVRLAIEFAAIEYGHERSNEAIDSLGKAWQASIDKHLGGKGDGSGS